ncbi:Txe/YoeB family addiction module toxin [Fusobacterium polymorphum]|uniref:Putative mRNA interferase YoeB n=1 Tax=Fusobacterium nucleatum subsp. polymorphum TaxID=76857 RepID=A0A2C6B5A8_FUSNP|nr:Txe/YoeB family addiction module toxin [Fusobacterium polymorphum]PHH99041.1 Txe/YoeB family addiction module toxin [Fusobacterium polymorphum]PHI09309.1 Txe/YoeB family addiction module toxin [Fusobacterium polymorphum]PIM76128.1 Txe/YoeB family addiction module toxin [Fusobacterium polymorphum]
MIKSWTDVAWIEYQYWISQDKKIFKKINELIKDIERNGVLNGIGKPEALKHRKGYSRRIDEKNRLIYEIINGQLYILNCKGHYED